jgi:hypothetical protein
MFSSGVYNPSASRRFTIHPRLKHQDRTRTVANLLGSPFPAHFTTQFKRKLQCLAMFKLFGEVFGGFCGRPRV